MICLEHLLSCPAQTGSNCLDAIVHGLPATACGAERARVYYCWLHCYFVNILNGKYIRAHRLQGRSRRVLRKKSTRPIRTLLTRPRQRIFQSSPPLLRSTASTVRIRQRPRPLKIMFNPIFRRSCTLRFHRIPGLACVKEKTAERVHRFVKRRGRTRYTGAAAGGCRRRQCGGTGVSRSEERRVGKECRSRWSPN